MKEYNDQLEIMIPYEQLNMKSIKRQQERAIRKETQKRQVIINTLAGGALLLTGIAVGITGVKAYEKNQESNNYKVTNNAIEKSIAPSGDSSANLIGKNVEIVHNNVGDPVFYTNYENIANDILKINDEFFDAAYYNAYIHFKAISDEKSNKNYINDMNAVTHYLGINADFENHQLANARTSGCSSFADFMKKNGFVSEEQYEKFGEQAISNYAAYLREEENKGVGR